MKVFVNYVKQLGWNGLTLGVRGGKATAPLDGSFFKSAGALHQKSLHSSAGVYDKDEFPSSFSSSMSFIDLAKAKGANHLLGTYMYKNGRFDSCLKDLVISSIKKGEVTCKLKNTLNTLHGGASATIIDVVGTIALLTLDATRPGVSVEINSSYMVAAAIGEDLTIHGKVLKTGKKLGFTQVEIRRDSDDAVVVIGRHTKAL